LVYVNILSARLLALPHWPDTFAGLAAIYYGVLSAGQKFHLLVQII